MPLIFDPDHLADPALPYLEHLAYRVRNDRMFFAHRLWIWGENQRLSLVPRSMSPGCVLGRDHEKLCELLGIGRLALARLSLCRDFTAEPAVQNVATALEMGPEVLRRIIRETAPYSP